METKPFRSEILFLEKTKIELQPIKFVKNFNELTEIRLPEYELKEATPNRTTLDLFHNEILPFYKKILSLNLQNDTITVDQINSEYNNKDLLAIAELFNLYISLILTNIDFTLIMKDIKYYIYIKDYIYEISPLFINNFYTNSQIFYSYHYNKILKIIYNILEHNQNNNNDIIINKVITLMIKHTKNFNNIIKNTKYIKNIEFYLQKYKRMLITTINISDKIKELKETSKTGYIQKIKDLTKSNLIKLTDTTTYLYDPGQLKEPISLKKYNLEGKTLIEEIDRITKKINIIVLNIIKNYNPRILTS